MTFRYVFIGLSIRSSWGNDHATTYRALLRALAERGHEADLPRAEHPAYDGTCDYPQPHWADVQVYASASGLSIDTRRWSGRLTSSS